MQEKRFWVYILASKPYGTIYTGMTSNLVKRVWEHKNGGIKGFTKTYKVNRLVYFEEHENAEAAITRERQMKEWKRDWKISLIEEKNPYWEDLYEGLSQ